MRAAPVREILMATDFSDEAEAALRRAADEARRAGARLHILHVLSGAEVEVTRLLADAVALAGRDVVAAVASTRGEPGTEILRYARRHAIDLIVMGTHGRSGFSRLLLGSVADRVLRGAPCPVLLVPSRARDAATDAAASPETADEVVAPAVRACLVCARPTHDLICEGCRAKIRGEVLEQNRSSERAGRM